MTKRHFIALANLVTGLEPLSLRPREPSPEHRQWEAMRDALATFCQEQNPRFLRQRWLDYVAGKCGPNGGK